VERRAAGAHDLCACAAGKRALAVCFEHCTLGCKGARSGSSIFIAFVIIEIAESDFVYEPI
jgi:predicted naringenin-chalcone synthase